jgi:transcription antitermination protein NusB
MDLPELGPDDEVTVEVIEHEAPATDRTVARRIALQVLYELDTTQHQPGIVLAARLEAQAPDRKQVRYVRYLVQDVLKRRVEIDRVIRRFVTEWPLDQVAKVDMNILRMAILELVDAKAPLSVVIDEAVNLAQLFGADSSLGFINGVLGQLALHDDALDALRDMKVSGEESG